MDIFMSRVVMGEDSVGVVGGGWWVYIEMGALVPEICRVCQG